MIMKQHKEKKLAGELPEGWEMRTATTLEEIEAIRPIWEKMLGREPFPVIDADIDRYLSVTGLKGNKAQPYIIILSYKGNPAAMVIGRIQKLGVRLALGYKTFLNPKLKSLTVVYGGILGERSSDVCILLVRKLMEQLKSRKVSMIYFNHLKMDSHIYNHIRKMSGILCRDYVPVIDLHWQTTLIDSKEQFYSSLSRNERRNIRRHTKQLEEKSSGSVELRSYHELTELDEFISIASEISSVTYQKTLTGGFTNSSYVRYLLEQAIRDNRLRAYILYSGTEPVAFELGLLYRGTYFAQYRGFHPEWSCGSPGSILLCKVLEGFSQDPDVKVYDYGFGNAPYKQRYGQNHWRETSISIFAPGLYPIVINMVRTLFIILNVALKYILRKLGVVSRVKRYWRKLLTKQAYRNAKQSKNTIGMHVAEK